MPLPPTEGSNHPVEVHPSLPGLGRVGAAASAPAVPTPVGSIAAVPLPPALSAAPTPVALLRALQRRWALALVLGVLGASIAATASWYLVPPPKYTARVMLHVWMKQPKVLFDTQENRSDYRTYQKTQVTLIGSRTVLEDALRQPEVAKLPLVREQVDPLEWLHEEIKAEFPGDSEVLVISMSASKRAKDVATLVNAVSDAYLRKIVEQEDRARLMRLEQIREIYAGFQKDLDVKRKRLKGLVESVGANDKQAITVQQRMALEQLGLAKEQRMHLQAELRRAQVEVAVQEAKEKAMKAQPIPASEIDGLIAQDASVRLYREQIQKYTDQYHYLKGKVRSERDPSLLSALQSLEAARRGLVARYAELRPTITEQLRAKDRGGKDGTSEQLRAQIAILAEYDAGLQKTIEELSDQTRAYNRESHELQTQQDDIVVVTEVAKKVGAEVGAMDIELKAPPRIEVVEKARPPRRQDELKKIKVSSMAAVGVFGATLLGVSLLEFRARRINSADEVVHGLGLRLVGELPSLTNRAWRYPALPGDKRGPSWDSLLVESVDTIRAMLLHASRVDSLRVVMVASALQGEGKTTLSGHLATSLARSGRKTLLIDSDLRSPAVHRIFDLVPGPGLCEALRGEVAISDVIRQTPATHLSIITAGSCDALALQGLTQDSLRSILDDLKARFDFVIVDSAPVLPVADSLVISQHVDAVIFSILRDVSRLPMVYAAYLRLESLGVRILGTVVTGGYVHRRYGSIF